MYYRGAKGAIVVFDCTNRVSFDKAEQWVTELRDRAPVDLAIALAGNKTDLSDIVFIFIFQREVSTAEAKQYADDNNLLYFETSAKTRVNVAECFEALVRRIPRVRQSKIDYVAPIDVSKQQSSCSC